jgi:RNA polymerase sigma-70 factor, ECF subfamily
VSTEGLSNRMQETDWIQDAMAGSATSFASLVDRYERPVYAFVLERTRDRELAQELVQETFVRAYEGLERYDVSQDFIKWLMGIAYHVTAEWLRSQQRQRRALDTVGQLQRAREQSAGGSSEVGEQNQELQQRILQAMADCPENYRVPLMMRYMDKMDYREIAETLQLSAGQVKGLLYRGTQMLRERLADLQK